MEAEQALQQKLDRVCKELREAQHGSTTLQAQVDAAKEQTKTLTGQYTQTNTSYFTLYVFPSIPKWKK